MVNVGLDVGYSSVKIVSDSKKFKFPSVVGNNEQWFSFGEKDSALFGYKGNEYLVGDNAIDQSQIVERREDRNWIKSEMYDVLVAYAITKMLYVDDKISVVSGLPLAYFNKDAELLKKILIGSRECVINGVSVRFEIANAIIVPQPFGTLLDYALTDDGGIIQDRASGRIGVIDIGGKTTNILSVEDLSERSREATSVNVGGWTLVRHLTDVLLEKYPDMDHRSSHMEKILTDKSFTYYGKKIDVSDIVVDASMIVSKQIEAEISQRWGSASQFDKILVSGGGANVVGSFLEDAFPQAVVANDNVFSNAKGFHKFAKRRGE